MGAWRFNITVEECNRPGAGLTYISQPTSSVGFSDLPNFYNLGNVLVRREKIKTILIKIHTQFVLPLLLMDVKFRP